MLSYSSLKVVLGTSFGDWIEVLGRRKFQERIQLSGPGSCRLEKGY
jgi:hypothetical protein